jgi:dihydrodipicolinate synthase/N-acetylneuraminate lyase
VVVVTIEPFDLLRPNRAVLGMSAVLLPFTAGGEVDWAGFEALIARTVEAGLVPAVNMDTGYVNLLDDTTQDRVLSLTADVVGGRLVPGHPDPFVAGAFVGDRPGDPYDADRYRSRIDAVRSAGATPVAFPSHGLNGLEGPALVEAHHGLAAEAGRLIAFELGQQFVPFGRIYDLATYEALLSIDGVIGAKHSSLDRQSEWDRLRVRDRVRPDFRVFTGNDLAIDMVMYGSDYLLGLSAFAPDAFARRDHLWAAGDAGFHQLNDVLQYLGAFAFRAPVPAYKHDAARFLALRGWIGDRATHPDAPTRPDADDEVLASLLERLEGELGR